MVKEKEASLYPHTYIERFDCTLQKWMIIGMAQAVLKSERKDERVIQPEVNIGTLGHVDNGKSTLVQALTGQWTARHSEELRRGITIRIGYADAFIYKCVNSHLPSSYTTKPKCPVCGSETQLARAVSFVDCPGHHSLMVTMLSGSALMDGALFVLASSANCPQAQDREHLLAAESVGIKKLVIVQNKIDVVSKERALENYKEIRAFVKGTIAEGAPIVPISAQHGTNIDILLKEIEGKIPTPKRDLAAPPRMYVLRSFEVNKPGTDVDDLVGGVIGGSIVQGVFQVGDQIEIKPGISVQEGGKTRYERLLTTVRSLSVTNGQVTEAKSGGLVGLGTDLDPSLTKSDGLVGSVVGKIDTLPPTLSKITLDVKLFAKVVGTELAVAVEKIRSNEALVLNIGTTVTSGLVSSAREDVADVALRKPVCADPGSKVAISRRISDSWRLIGFGTLKA